MDCFQDFKGKLNYHSSLDPQKIFNMGRVLIQRSPIRLLDIVLRVHHLCNHSCMSISSRRNMQSNLFKYTSLYRHERRIGCFYFFFAIFENIQRVYPLFICFRLLQIDINTMKNFYDMHYFHQFQSILPLPRLPPLSNRHYVLLTASLYTTTYKSLEYNNVWIKNRNSKG